jgi:hypothetical protein
MLASCHIRRRGQKLKNQIVANSCKCVGHILAFFFYCFEFITMSYIWNLWFAYKRTIMNSYATSYIC